MSLPVYNIGRFSSRAVFILGTIYALTTLFGFLSLKSPQDPIADPFFTVMEILILLIAPLMAVSMVAVHYFASPDDKLYSLAALFFMFLMAGITSSLHFIILTMSHLGYLNELSKYAFIFSFRWFSVVYALDILAWNWFFALSFLFAAPVFKTGSREKLVRILMIFSGLLSLIGLVGIPLDNVQFRNISIIGYAVIAPVVFLILGKILGTQKIVKHK